MALRRDGDRTTVLLDDDERSMLIDLAEQFRSVLAADADPDLRLIGEHVPSRRTRRSRARTCSMA